MADDNLNQTLDRILEDLRGNDTARCLNAIQELGTLNASSKAIVLQLERLALTEDAEIRAAALAALSLRTSQFVSSNRTSHSSLYRNLLLKEIDAWQQDGLLEPQRAEVLRRRYDFDSKPATSHTPVPVAAAQEPLQQSAPANIESAPAVPRPSLTQTLLSESSIKVYLYLGAFFVIASALILAAVVEAARLPILVAATSAFGGGAFLLRRRLPQPSFALFIVFSFLLPIDANVFEETIGISEPGLSLYWTVVFLLMSAVWAFSVWFYTSSFFGVVAFAALSLAFYRAGQIAQTEIELQVFLGMLASLAGLGGTSLVTKWRDKKFAMPVFMLAQLQAVGLLCLSLALAAIHEFDSGISAGWWLLIALTWIAAASFFALSDRLFPFVLFPWMAVAVLLPLPWLVLHAFEPDTLKYTIGFWIWAAAFAAASETVWRFEKLRKYHWALLSGTVPLFLIAGISMLIWDRQSLTFTLLAGMALVYAGLHYVRPRWYAWSAALLAALAAYFAFFSLPSISSLDVPILYQLSGATLLLTVPELFAKTPLTVQNQTRLPTITLGLIVAVFCVLAAFTVTADPGPVAITMLVFAILLTLHAMHFRRAEIGYVAVAAEILAVLYALDYLGRDLWLPAMAGLSVLYYGTGFFLRRRNTSFQEWAPVLINSALILGALLSPTAILLEKEAAGWFILLIAALFLVEIFARPLAWLEPAVESLLSLALYWFLVDLAISQPLEHFLFGTSLLWLGGDLLFSRLVEKRIHRPVTLGIGYLLLLASAAALFIASNASLASLYFALYALFFGIYAYSEREPRLGYFVTAFLPLAVIRASQAADFQKWIFPLIVLAALYYVLGAALRFVKHPSGWDKTLLNSGLALGVLTSIASPFQGGLDSAIPVAIAATLFAAEAFTRRDVWWALPANGLYLMSYFMILAELNVEQPQYYSIGAALLGMLMHYLLTRAGSSAGAFLAGMLSQLVLLGTTYIQMVSANELRFFFVLFIQSLVILGYGLVLRSRSLVITPIAFAVLGVVTVVYSALKGLSSVILIGCTGVLLLMLGIMAVIMRERITKLGEQLSDWKP